MRGAGTKNAPQFAAVRVDRLSTEGVIEIDLASRCIRVRGILDAAMLREVLSVTVVRIDCANARKSRLFD